MGEYTLYTSITKVAEKVIEAAAKLQHIAHVYI